MTTLEILLTVFFFAAVLSAIYQNERSGRHLVRAIRAEGALERANLRIDELEYQAEVDNPEGGIHWNGFMYDTKKPSTTTIRLDEWPEDLEK